MSTFNDPFIHPLIKRTVIIAETYLTAYQAVVWNGYLKDGESILIHAVSSIIT